MVGCTTTCARLANSLRLVAMLGLGQLIAPACIEADVRAELTSFDGSVTDTFDASTELLDACWIDQVETWVMPDCEQACFPGGCISGQWCSIGGPLQCSDILCSPPAKLDMAVAWRVASVRVLPRASSCDLNGDGYPDNRIADAIERKLDSQLGQDSRQNGAMGMFVASSPSQQDQPFAVDWLIGGHDPGMAACGDATQNCLVVVRKQSWNLGKFGTCKPLSPCSAKWAGTQIAIDCPTMAPFAADLWGPLLLTGRDVTATGTLNATTAMGTLKVCGRYAMSEVALQKNNLPPPMLSQLASRLALLTPDLDMEGDGTQDSISFGYEFVLAPAQLAGAGSQQ